LRGDSWEKRTTEGFHVFRTSRSERSSFPLFSSPPPSPLPLCLSSLVIDRTGNGSARCFGIVRQGSPGVLLHPESGKRPFVSKYRIACVPSRSDFLAVYPPPTHNGTRSRCGFHHGDRRAALIAALFDLISMLEQHGYIVEIRIRVRAIYGG